MIRQQLYNELMAILETWHELQEADAPQQVITQYEWRAFRAAYALVGHLQRIGMTLDGIAAEFELPAGAPTAEALAVQFMYTTPSSNPVDGSQYETFHGVEPDCIEEKETWVPGDLVLLGVGVDVGYVARDHRSNKGPGPYVHDFDSGVRVFRRAKHGEKADKTYRNFPETLTVLGKALGFSYRDQRGQLREVKGGTKKLAVTPNRRILAIVGSGGVEYVIEGGNMHVEDWIRN